MHMPLVTPDRRRRARGFSDDAPTRSEITARILGCYAEMPGLRLTLTQASRLFSLDPHGCQVVLDALVREGRIRRDEHDQYALAD